MEVTQEHPLPNNPTLSALRALPFSWTTTMLYRRIDACHGRAINFVSALSESNGAVVQR